MALSTLTSNITVINHLKLKLCFIKHSPLIIPTSPPSISPAPGNHHSMSCPYGSDCSGDFMWVGSHNGCLLWLAPLSEHSVLEVHLCCSTCQSFFPFRGWIISWIAKVTCLPTHSLMDTWVAARVFFKNLLKVKTFGFRQLSLTSCKVKTFTIFRFNPRKCFMYGL